MPSSNISKTQIAANILKNFQPDLIKGGEGSRGGKVIGHTKSGKPIYKHPSGEGQYHGDEVDLQYKSKNNSPEHKEKLQAFHDAWEREKHRDRIRRSGGSMKPEKKAEHDKRIKELNEKLKVVRKKHGMSNDDLLNYGNETDE